MIKKITLVFLMISMIPFTGFTQFLSNLNATKGDAIYSTYAAPLERSDYKTDQGYKFNWNDPKTGIQFVSNDGINFGLAVRSGETFRFRLEEMYREPVVTESYSDLVHYFYYPFPDIRVEVMVAIYSSQIVIEDIRIINEGSQQVSLGVYPYTWYPSDDSVRDIQHESPFNCYSFPLKKNRDGWMKEHDIPFTEDLNGYINSNLISDNAQSFCFGSRSGITFPENDPFRELKRSFLLFKKESVSLKGLIFSRSFRIYAGETIHFRIIRSLGNRNARKYEVMQKMSLLSNLGLEKLEWADRNAYSGIHEPSGLTPDQKMLFWSSFSLLKQCMMPPQGKCNTNYYIFSREPKWGWGYGGQVFHESLSMLAYAYMDPQGAMNSQRVYFDRQQPDGYINYRTGPYLDEIIEYGGKLTSSAPWFNYENLEVYKITRDRRFLKEAYESGNKFYQFYVANRDSNHNGLCEWGGEASLESVRDARVAVWDKVGWPSNFEGPDVNSMLVMEAKSLSEMAKLLGLPAEEKKWSADAAARAKLINKYMWDKESGFYYNISRNDQSFTFRNRNDLKIKEIIGFLPLWAGVADKDQAAILLKKMTDPCEFWRNYGVPTLSAKESYYNPMGYWNGPVWVQWNYLLFRGLIDYGFKKEAKELALKVLENITWHLKNDHVFWEFYSPDEHQAGWNETYIWAGLAARFLIDLEKL